LDHNARRPFYLCAPNDVWSLGVILVNLTCGRNPWKQASSEDSTYRAYTRSQDFLKNILPLTDELNDILGRIFTRNPDHRITLPELRNRILACTRFTTPTIQAMAAPLPTLPATPEPIEYVDCEDTIVDTIGVPLSPTSSISDEGSECSSDDGSLTSSGSSLDDFEDDFTPEPQQQQQELPHDCPSPHAYDPEEPRMAMYPTQEFVPQHYTGPIPVPVQDPLPEPMPIQVQVSLPVQVQGPVPISCAPKPFLLQQWWDVAKVVAQQQTPIAHQVPFFHQVPSFPLQGCY
jgi:serine/threonine protein kinase